MDELTSIVINVLLSSIVSAFTGFIGSKYYGERWVENRDTKGVGKPMRSCLACWG